MGEVPDEFKELIKDLFYTFIFDQDFSRIARAYKKLGIITDEMGTDEEVGLRIQMVVAPMLGPTSHEPRRLHHVLARHDEAVGRPPPGKWSCSPSRCSTWSATSRGWPRTGRSPPTRSW